MRARLLTGATDGIGLELARLWAARDSHFLDGATTFLHGRRALETLEPGLFRRERYVQADLADPAAPERIARFLEERGVRELELLVLNAAAGWVGAPEELPPVRARELLEVDLVAPLRLCHLLLPLLRAARSARGRVVFVSSLAARLACPRFAAYAAAKNAAEGFFRSLAIELRGEVEVQVVRPGAVRTGLHAKSGVAPEELMVERFPPAASVARAIDAALAGSPRWRTIGAANLLLSGLARTSPALVDRLMRRPRRAGPEPGSGGKRCAVTGAARGIGRALAERFARAGFALTLIDVDECEGERAREELSALGVPVELLTADLARAAGVDELGAELARREPFDVFVHNAGVNAVGRFADLSWEDQRAVLEVNLAAPLVLTGDLLRADRIAPGGSLVFVSSLSRFVSYPGASVYAASKEGLAHLARSLRSALAPRGVHVLTVYPGPTRTEHARRHAPPGSREERRMDPAELAERVFRALERRKQVLVPGLSNQLFAAAGHALPGLAELAMKRAILDRLPSASPRRSDPSRSPGSGSALRG